MEPTRGQCVSRQVVDELGRPTQGRLCLVKPAKPMQRQCKEGFRRGYEKGFDEGFAAGFAAGYAAGYSDGASSCSCSG